MRVAILSLLMSWLMGTMATFGQEISGPVAVSPVDPEAVPRPGAQATRAAGALVLDGVLDEAAWHRADSVTGFIQTPPYPGYSASEPTVVRILYDDQYLYIGAICYASKPEDLTVMSLEQDFSTRDNDLFGMTPAV